MRNNRAHDIRHCRAEITARNVCRKMKMSMIKPIFLLLRNNRLMILNQMRGIRRQSRLKVVFICVFAAIIAAAAGLCGLQPLLRLVIRWLLTANSPASGL